MDRIIKPTVRKVRSSCFTGFTHTLNVIQDELPDVVFLVKREQLQLRDRNEDEAHVMKTVQRQASSVLMSVPSL